MIIVVDEPTSTVKYGSVVAAPYISELMEKVLPYLEYKSTAEDTNYTIENYVGMNINSALGKIKATKIAYEIVGNGDTVLSQMPLAGDKITTSLSKIILYTTDIESDKVKVPNLLGLIATEAITKATNAGLSIKIIGSNGFLVDGLGVIAEQSIPPDMMVKRGSVILLRIIREGFED